MKKLSISNLKNINGGVVQLAPFAIGVGIYLLADGFEHSDQIYKGFKRGWNGGR